MGLGLSIWLLFNLAPRYRVNLLALLIATTRREDGLNAMSGTTRSTRASSIARTCSTAILVDGGIDKSHRSLGASTIIDGRTVLIGATTQSTRSGHADGDTLATSKENAIVVCVGGIVVRTKSGIQHPERPLAPVMSQ